MLLTLLLACLSVLSAAILASIFCDDSLGFSFNKKQTHVFKISPSPNIKAILNFVCNVEDLNTKTNFTYRRQALLREFLVQYLSNFLSSRLYFIEFVIKSSWKSKKNTKNECRHVRSRPVALTTKTLFTQISDHCPVGFKTVKTAKPPLSWLVETNLENNK